MSILSLPAILAVVLGLLIIAEGYSFTTRPMARGLSKSELRQRYAKSLPSTIKMRALVEESEQTLRDL